jgi:hypothetical protein
VSFPEVIPVILKLYIGMDSDSEVWENVHEDFLTLEEWQKGGYKDPYRFDS